MNLQQDNLNQWRDENENIRILNHNQDPVYIEADSAQEIARKYISEVGGLYGIQDTQSQRLEARAEESLVAEEDASFRLDVERKNADTTVVSFVQTYFGLPVWEAALNVVVKENPSRVLSSNSTAHPDIDVRKPSDENIQRAEAISEADLQKVFGLESTGSIKINRKRLLIYKYDASQRTIEPKKERAFAQDYPTLPLPDVSDNIKDGNFYVVEEVLFSMPLPNWGDLNWRAFIEVETMSVLYLRALVACADGYVFRTDPITQDGVTTPTANNAALNPLRGAPVTLEGLIAPVAGVQSLSGNFVSLADLEPPSTFPTESAPFEFRYNARTDSFAAVNAYHHCDAFFRMMQNMGFEFSGLNPYFNNTVFPVPVDHAIGDYVNAFCYGNVAGNGIGSVRFALCDESDLINPLGIAADWRVVLHEIGGHGILWDHADSPNFGFAHSAGDSVAAILNDPGSNAPDRFETFPFTLASAPGVRRHDRAVASDWGWGGANDFGDGSYESEQILATTLFRFYRSIGGDSTSLASKQFAARFAVYLIIKAVGLVTPGSTPNALNFEVLLETADADDWNSLIPAETHDGGAYHKVIRWAFEKQGLFRDVGDPVTSEGRPPNVDVYINDGRNGEYPYQPNWWSCTDIWNRRTVGDGGGVHEDPIVGQTNYAYVRIKNRGGQTAADIIVKGFHCFPGVGLTYPTDWQPMTTAQLPAPDLAGNDNVGIVVGPFDWIPSQVGHECMFFSVAATGDAGNIDGRVSGPIPEWRLVPHDNNIGQRNVTPVPAFHGGFIRAIERLPFRVRNPFERNVKIKLVPVLPKFLAERRWELRFTNEGGGEFYLKSGEARQITLAIKKGKDFDKKLAFENKEDITIHAYADELLIGGMSYPLDPEMEVPESDKEHC